MKKGGPKVLKHFADHTLFLCYPDDFEDTDESLALSCLEYYTGETVICVGEEGLGNTLMENPFGKSAAPEFQIELASTFHKILRIPLPSWPGSRNCLTVWKRTRKSKVEDLEFSDIPSEELLDLTQTAPCMKKWLKIPAKAENATNATNSPSKKRQRTL